MIRPLTDQPELGAVYDLSTGRQHPSNRPSLPSGYEPIGPKAPVHELGLEAQKHWHRLQRFELISNVVTGILFIDGEEQTQQAASKAESPSLLFVGFEANFHVSVSFS